MKARCPNCGQFQEFDAHDEGLRVVCGHCSESFEAPIELSADDESGRALSARPSVGRRQSAIAQDSWLPPDAVTEHRGDEFPPNSDFFAEPPEEIGEVRSASTSLRGGQRRYSLFFRLLVAGLGGAAGVAVGFWFDKVGEYVAFWHYFWLTVTPLAGIIAGWMLTAFVHTCTFIGDEGAARITCRSERSNISSKELFLFDDASELKAERTRNFVNGVYSNTTYSFVWTNAEGRRMFAVVGSHRQKDDNPPRKDPYHFGQALETAWTRYLLRHALREIQTNGSYFFRLDGKDWIEVGPGWIDFHVKGKSNRFSQEDLKSAKVAEGHIVIRSQDAKEGWLWHKGIFQFPYANIANARLFLVLLENFCPAENLREE